MFAKVICVLVISVLTDTSDASSIIFHNLLASKGIIISTLSLQNSQQSL